MSYQQTMNNSLDEIASNLRNLQYQFIHDVEPSQIWHSSALTKPTKQRLKAAMLMFIVKISPVIAKYHEKQTMKAEFIADVLEDYYYDLLQRPLDDFDDEINDTYTNDGQPLTINDVPKAINDAVNNLSANLYERCQHPKKLVKILKQAYEDNRELIYHTAHQDDGQLDLSLITDISANFRDLLY